MSHHYEKATAKVLEWLHLAERDLVGRIVATFNGEAGTIRELKLDELHGICFTMDDEVEIIEGTAPRRFYPVSTIKLYGPKEGKA